LSFQPHYLNQINSTKSNLKSITHSPTGPVPTSNGDDGSPPLSGPVSYLLNWRVVFVISCPPWPHIYKSKQFDIFTITVLSLRPLPEHISHIRNIFSLNRTSSFKKRQRILSSSSSSSSSSWSLSSAISRCSNSPIPTGNLLEDLESSYQTF